MVFMQNINKKLYITTFGAVEVFWLLAITIKIAVRPEKELLELFQKFSGALIFIITLTRFFSEQSSNI